MEASVVKPPEEAVAAVNSPSSPTEVETEKSPVTAEQVVEELHKVSTDGAESDKARTDTDDDEEEPQKQQQQIVQGDMTLQMETMQVEQEPTPVVQQEAKSVVQQQEDQVEREKAIAVEQMQDEPGTPTDQQKDLVNEDEETEKEATNIIVVQDEETGPTMPRDEEEHKYVKLSEVELVIPSPKRPAPLNLVHHDIDDEESDSDDHEGSPVAEGEEEGADLGTPLGYGGTADFGEGQDELVSHRFLGPSVPSDPSSVRALHGLRRVSLQDKPPRFVSEASTIATSSGSMTSTGSGESGRTSSSASGMQSADPKHGLRSQSEADYMEHPLNTYSLTFTEPVLGFNTNVVVSLENELLVEVWSVDKDSPAQRAGVVVGDYLISVNGQLIEAHMTKEQVFEIIQTSTIPRTLVFQRDVHDKDGAQSKSLPDRKYSLAKPIMGRLGAAMTQGASIIGSKWKRKKTLVHVDSFCDGCGMDPVVGALWTCSVCSNYNLCNECYDLGTHGMENTEQIQALSEAIVQYKLQKKCKQFTPEFLLSLRRDICKGRPDKFEYLGGWIADIVVGTSAAKITVRGIEIPSLPAVARQRFVSYLMPLVSNRTDIEVNIEWLPDDADHVNAAGRPSVDRMSAGAIASDDEDGDDDVAENLEKLRIWISDKKTRTTSPFA
ncbi:hypothetical protein JM18_009616 [Phytophthora kernoviae]|uniref:PDZ domain-containing protein n=2 Tax=Phytophthora kernoviae TaxID=325452 RepID=A0A8T0LJ43_9STRA|nr:hypothetical protein G195_011215 [Phytophthora kernoviae 00238/432]KAG2502823.1 hypothetical protein JM16_009584 [Phytophthora kernoviae]KAG2503587.1 hypothetical protein JM18_009616 [Phytophthora kernoviae]